MKAGIIGLPQVGKTSLFKILTKQDVAATHDPRAARIGVTQVPDERLDKASEMFKPKKTVHATIEYVDVGGMSAEALKESSYLANLRGVDALMHVVRAFEDESIAHAGPIEPLRDIKTIDFDMIVSDLGQIEKRLERVEKDLKRAKTPEIEKEHALLVKAKTHLETESPLREMEMTPDERKMVRGFEFLSQKPILYVLNISESPTLGKDLDEAVGKYKLTDVASRPNAGATAVCGKVEAELAEMSDEEAADFLGSYGLHESGLSRIINKTYDLLGLISFLTVGEDECRAWTITKGTKAVDAAGTIHSDLAKHFIRAETIHWNQLLEAGSEANARAKGTLRLEGKEYIVKDGDVLHIRHSG
jgi:GTP-binding protein YchF